MRAFDHSRHAQFDQIFVSVGGGGVLAVCKLVEDVILYWRFRLLFLVLGLQLDHTLPHRHLRNTFIFLSIFTRIALLWDYMFYGIFLDIHGLSMGRVMVGGSNGRGPMISLLMFLRKLEGDDLDQILEDAPEGIMEVAYLFDHVFCGLPCDVFCDFQVEVAVDDVVGVYLGVGVHGGWFCLQHSDKAG